MADSFFNFAFTKYFWFYWNMVDSIKHVEQKNSRFILEYSNLDDRTVLYDDRTVLYKARSITQLAYQKYNDRSVLPQTEVSFTWQMCPLFFLKNRTVLFTLFLYQKCPFPKIVYPRSQFLYQQNPITCREVVFFRNCK